MGESTSIQWCDHTWNPWWGCKHVSPGCDHCYAETFAIRMGLDIWGTGDRRFFGDNHWDEPHRWNRKAMKSGRRRVFCSSMADVFENRRDLDAPRARLWGLIEDTTAIDWQLLTKWPENVAMLVPPDWMECWPRNVWLGVSAETQEYAKRRINLALKIKRQARVSVVFVSYEPALGPVDFRPWLYEVGMHMDGSHDYERIDWIIIGGESGHGARPFDVDWARHVARACRRASVPVFVKQLGAKPYVPCACGAGKDWRCEHGGGPMTLRDSKGGYIDEWPADLRVREMPDARTPS